MSPLIFIGIHSSSQTSFTLDVISWPLAYLTVTNPNQGQTHLEGSPWRDYPCLDLIPESGSSREAAFMMEHEYTNVYALLLSPGLEERTLSPFTLLEAEPPGGGVLGDPTVDHS